MMKMNFYTEENSDRYKISPLGAALVEAMPDRKLMKRIEANFKRSGDCPTSAIFKTAADVNAYYAKAKRKGGA